MAPTSNDKHLYSSLLEEEEDQDAVVYTPENPIISTRKARIWTVTAISSILLNLGLVAFVSFGLRRREIHDHAALVDNPQIQNYAYHHFTDYSSPTGEDTPEIQALWKTIKSEHGSIAVDKQWAREHNLDPALSFPTDATKGVYGIDAYHQMHCLVLLRTGFYNLYRHDPNPFTKSLDHYSHCFDHLRQSIMCEASDVLWATQYGGMTGDGQIRKCRDWSLLRKWAGKHSICDKNDVHHLNDFLGEDICHGDSDGLQELGA